MSLDSQTYLKDQGFGEEPKFWPGPYSEKSNNAYIRRYWKFYRWITAKYNVTPWNMWRARNKNKYTGKHRNIIKALARNKSPESKQRLEKYKLDNCLS